MTVTKVADLPQEEQDKLIAEAKEYNIKGLLTSYGVDTLKAKIQKAKDEKANGEQNTPGNEQKDANGEQSTPEAEQNTSGNEQKDANDEQSTPEAEQNTSGNEQKDANDEQNTSKGEQPDTDAKSEPKQEKTKICHICRSKVIDGKCQGCGFELRK